MYRVLRLGAGRGIVSTKKKAGIVVVVAVALAAIAGGILAGTSSSDKPNRGDVEACQAVMPTYAHMLDVRFAGIDESHAAVRDVEHAIGDVLDDVNNTDLRDHLQLGHV